MFKIFLSLALALGLSTAVVGTTSAAHAAPVGSGVTRAAADCSAEQSAVDAARARKKATKQKLAKAQRVKKRTVKKLRRAKADDNRSRVVKLKKKVRKLKKQTRVLTRRLRNQNRAVQLANAVLAECRNGTGAAESPIQDLCDAGLPQVLCDGLGGLVPGGSAASPLQALCDAVPQLQPLCDAAGGGLPTDPAALTSLLQPLLDALGLGDLLGGGGGGLTLQALCDAGLPQEICDALGGELEPGAVPLDAFCDAVAAAEAICAAIISGGGALPTDPDTLVALLEPLEPLLDALGLGGLLDDLIDDILGGLLGGILGRQGAPVAA